MTNVINLNTEPHWRDHNEDPDAAYKYWMERARDQIPLTAEEIMRFEEAAGPLCISYLRNIFVDYPEKRL